MLERGSGVIVNIASMSGSRRPPERSTPALLPRAYSRTLFQEDPASGWFRQAFSRLTSSASGRGGFGATDIWVSTRHNITDSWSPPVNLGAPVNTAGGELEAAISHDGSTLVFSGTMARGSSLGLQAIWIATRAHGSQRD
jgi:hypothetical protein